MEYPVNSVAHSIVCCRHFFVSICIFFFLSGSIIPPMILHYVWNWFNPLVLGNIYRNTPEIANGNILLINGEGLLGAILGTCFVALYTGKYR